MYKGVSNNFIDMADVHETKVGTLKDDIMNLLHLMSNNISKRFDDLSNSQKQFDKHLSAIDEQLDSRISTLNKRLLDNLSEQVGKPINEFKEHIDTRLDKRNENTDSKLDQVMDTELGDFGSESDNAVSYTHLDVYKRQQLRFLLTTCCSRKYLHFQHFSFLCYFL